MFLGLTLVFALFWLGAVYWIETLVAQSLRQPTRAAGRRELLRPTPTDSRSFLYTHGRDRDRRLRPALPGQVIARAARSPIAPAPTTPPPAPADAGAAARARVRRARALVGGAAATRPVGGELTGVGCRRASTSRCSLAWAALGAAPRRASARVGRTARPGSPPRSAAARRAACLLRRPARRSSSRWRSPIDALVGEALLGAHGPARAAADGRRAADRARARRGCRSGGRCRSAAAARVARTVARSPLAARPLRARRALAGSADRWAPGSRSTSTSSPGTSRRPTTSPLRDAGRPRARAHDVPACSGSCCGRRCSTRRRCARG